MAKSKRWHRATCAATNSFELVEAITRGDAATEEEDDRLVQLFEDSVVHPADGRWVSACRTSVAAG
jgi:hypothetical protein